MHLWHSLQTAATVLATLNRVASFPLQEAISARGILPQSTIFWVANHGDRCIVDKSESDGGQVSLGPCDDSAAQWQFNGDNKPYDGKNWYWVGAIRNADRGGCLTVAENAEITQGLDGEIAPGNRNSYKIITTDCVNEDGDTGKRQQWFLGVLDDGSRFITVANYDIIDCRFPGVHYPDGRYYYDFRLFSTNADNNMIVGICQNPSAPIPGWNAQIGDQTLEA